jgi:DNA-binding MarR family transcriptional regulator
MADVSRRLRALHLLVRGLGRVGRDRAHTNGLTPQQADAVELLESRGVLSTCALAGLLGIDPSTASRNLAGLHRLGLITRKRGGHDARETQARLTPKGTRMAENLAAETARAFSALLERVARVEHARVGEALEVLARSITSMETMR